MSDFEALILALTYSRKINKIESERFELGRHHRYPGDPLISVFRDPLFGTEWRDGEVSQGESILEEIKDANNFSFLMIGQNEKVKEVLDRMIADDLFNQKLAAYRSAPEDLVKIIKKPCIDILKKSAAACALLGQPGSTITYSSNKVADIALIGESKALRRHLLALSAHEIVHQYQNITDNKTTLAQYEEAAKSVYELTIAMLKYFGDVRSFYLYSKSAYERLRSQIFVKRSDLTRLSKNSKKFGIKFRYEWGKNNSRWIQVNKNTGYFTQLIYDDLPERSPIIYSGENRSDKKTIWTFQELTRERLPDVPLRYNNKEWLGDWLDSFKMPRKVLEQLKVSNVRFYLSILPRKERLPSKSPKDNLRREVIVDENGNPLLDDDLTLNTCISNRGTVFDREELGRFEQGLKSSRLFAVLMSDDKVIAETQLQVDPRYMECMNGKEYTDYQSMSHHEPNFIGEFLFYE